MGLKRHCDVCDAVMPGNYRDAKRDSSAAGGNGVWIDVGMLDLDDVRRDPSMMGGHPHLAATPLAGSYCSLQCLLGRAIALWVNRVGNSVEAFQA